MPTAGHRVVWNGHLDPGPRTRASDEVTAGRGAGSCHWCRGDLRPALRPRAPNRRRVVVGGGGRSGGGDLRGGSDVVIGVSRRRAARDVVGGVGHVGAELMISFGVTFTTMPAPYCAGLSVAVTGSSSSPERRSAPSFRRRRFPWPEGWRPSTATKEPCGDRRRRGQDQVVRIGHKAAAGTGFIGSVVRRRRPQAHHLIAGDRHGPAGGREGPSAPPADRVSGAGSTGRSSRSRARLGVSLHGDRPSRRTASQARCRRWQESTMTKCSGRSDPGDRERRPWTRGSCFDSLRSLTFFSASAHASSRYDKVPVFVRTLRVRPCRARASSPSASGTSREPRPKWLGRETGRPSRWSPFEGRFVLVHSGYLVLSWVVQGVARGQVHQCVVELRDDQLGTASTSDRSGARSRPAARRRRAPPEPRRSGPSPAPALSSRETSIRWSNGFGGA